MISPLVICKKTGFSLPIVYGGLVWEVYNLIKHTCTYKDTTTNTYLPKSPVTSHSSRFTTVFGVGIFAETSISVAKFQHMASVFAEWMDNDGDGCVDNPLVLTKVSISRVTSESPCIEVYFLGVHIAYFLYYQTQDPYEEHSVFG